jgi:sacsin
MICPVVVTPLLQARGMEALCDIAELAEAAGAEALELWLDCRQHPSQSMLLPGLAAFQGLAICIRIPGEPR